MPGNAPTTAGGSGGSTDTSIVDSVTQKQTDTTTTKKQTTDKQTTQTQTDDAPLGAIANPLDTGGSSTGGPDPFNPADNANQQAVEAAPTGLFDALGSMFSGLFGGSEG